LEAYAFRSEIIYQGRSDDKMKYCPLCERSYEDGFEVCDLDGAKLRVSGVKEDSLIGKVIKGRYEVLKKLGQGGMGAVYLANQFAINRKVALKILQSDYARNEDFVRRFRQEATLAASFSHHNIVTIFDFDQAEDGGLYIAMEFVDGQSLDQMIRNNPMEVDTALRLGIQIAEGLNAAHRTGVIHRDIKPANIMVVKQGSNIKLLDFGIARLRDSTATTRLTQPGMIMGTPAYMAPEQIEGGELSDRTDMYAFGIVLYEMLTGHVPFDASTPGAVLVKHLRESPPLLGKIRKGMLLSVESTVTRMLQKDPQNRFGKMDEVTEALRKSLQESERQKPVVGESLVPQISNLRRGLSAIQAPLKRLLLKGSSASVKGEKSVSGAVEDRQAVANKPSKTREPPIHPPPEMKSDSSASAPSPPALRPLAGSRSARADSTRQPGSDDPLQTPSAKTSPPTAQKTPYPIAASPDDPVPDTLAYTRPTNVPEPGIEHQRPSDEYRIDTRTKPINRAVAETAIEPGSSGNHQIYPSLRAHRSTAGSQQPNTEVVDALTGPEYKATIIRDVSTADTPTTNGTIAETITFTRQIDKTRAGIRKVTIPLMVGAVVILTGAVAGTIAFRYFGASSSTLVSTKTQPETTPGIALQTPSESEGAGDQPKENATAQGQRTSSSAPKINNSGTRTDWESLEKKPKDSRDKPVEKVATPLSVAATKKPPAPLPVDRASSDSAKASTTRVDTRPLVRQAPASNRTKNNDLDLNAPVSKQPDISASGHKEEPEPKAGSQVASLKRPEPPPAPVRGVELKELSILSDKRELQVKERSALTLKGRYSDGREDTIRAGVQWMSSDASVARVNSNGEIEALKEGKTQISATYDGVVSRIYTFSIRGGEEPKKVEESGEQIKDLRRRLLR